MSDQHRVNCDNSNFLGDKLLFAIVEILYVDDYIHYAKTRVSAVALYDATTTLSRTKLSLFLLTTWVLLFETR